MALSHYVTYSDTGTKASINLDASISPFAVSVGVYLASTGTYGIQYSLDPIDTSDANSRWFNDSTLPAGTTSSGSTFYAFPVTKVRIVIVANGSTIELKTLQGFTTN